MRVNKQEEMLGRIQEGPVVHLMLCARFISLENKCHHQTMFHRFLGFLVSYSSYVSRIPFLSYHVIRSFPSARRYGILAFTNFQLLSSTTIHNPEFFQLTFPPLPFHLSNFYPPCHCRSVSRTVW